MTLFLVAFSLNILLFILIFKLRLHLLNIPFVALVWLWVLVPLTLLFLRWTRMAGGFLILGEAYQVVTIILGLVAVGYAFWHRQNRTQAIIARGLLAMEIISLAMRLWHGMGLEAKVDREVYLVMNTAFVWPSLYLIVALFLSQRKRKLSPWEIRLADILHEHRGVCSDCIRGRNCPDCLRSASLAAGYFYDEGLQEWEPRRGARVVTKIAQFFSGLLSIAR